jgi:hypothetical protein
MKETLAKLFSVGEEGFGGGQTFFVPSMVSRVFH